MPAECAVCGATAPVSAACPHCGTPVCDDHRDPGDHDCAGTAAGSTGGWRLDLDGRPRDGARALSDTTADSVTTGGSVTTADSVPDEGGDGDEPRHSLAWLLRPGAGLAVATLVVVAVALGAVAYAGPLGGGPSAEDVEYHVEERTNEERTVAGVGTAEHDAALAAVAREHSRDMRDRGYVDHVDPEGRGPADRVEAAGLACQPGENIYQAPRGALASSERALADHVVRAWLDSPGHRETLLRARYERQGVGVAVGGSAVYVTQVFC